MFFLVLIGSFTAISAASSTGVVNLARRDWDVNQINSTWCSWMLPRAAVIRDTLYIDGGFRSYLSGFANGSVAPDQQYDSSQFYTLNFSRPFKTSDNASDTFEMINKTAGASNNLAPEFLDGMMFANDGELYLYGGLLRDTDSMNPPSESYVLGYERYQWGPEREAWSIGFYEGTLPPNVTRYVTAGAGVNIPSENLGFYFSGMRRPDWGEIRTLGRREYNATVAANSLISVDMSTMRAEKWSNDTLPSQVSGRANAELAWIPVSDRGVLLAIGGVVNPEWAFIAESDAQKIQNQYISPQLMSTISVYDVNTQRWFSQNASGDIPPQLTQACSVVASAKDGSSHNIYLYGGYSGLPDSETASDDVYILSVPSFVWVKAYNGSGSHGRQGHRCAKPYPDQMLVIGGSPMEGTYADCVEDGVIQIFNLNTLMWQDSYDPSVWTEYEVPDIVTAQIGGNINGSATRLSPAAWDNSDLSGLFSTKYTKTITTYYPYPSINETSTPAPPHTNITIASPSKSHNGVPSWAAAVLGVILGLVFLIAIITAILLWRRRRYLRMYGSSTGTMSNRQRILSWMSGTPPAKAPTVTTTEETSGRRTTVTSTTEDVSTVRDAEPPQEAASSQVHELADTSVPSELPSPGSETEKNGSHFFGPRPRANSPADGLPLPDSPTTGVGNPVPNPAAFHPAYLDQASKAGRPDAISSPSPRSEGGSAKHISSDEFVSPISPKEEERIGKAEEEAAIGSQRRPTWRQSSFGEDLE
ncbi:hypothetical protein L228DRAFT_280669 [Xylona heveae TC161]|uniref:Galactose oxidase n=1 Tax=Xylona heveae (strain CBS 132557 / TC161) TaxID=1328760 RepID=A0A161TGV0_XYLHT|nr:hypothetical protein L228DRAFT_280669 [Xylona heveae TC161]KZF25427.1 hypothetical protein L228DRAFT_280669 [Xylona heveae TC161]